MWDTWPRLKCRATAGVCSLTDSEGGAGLPLANAQQQSPPSGCRSPWGSCSSGGSARHAAVSQAVLAPPRPCPQHAVITEPGGGSCRPPGHGWRYAPGTGCPVLPLTATQPEGGKLIFTVPLESPSQPAP